MTYVLWIVQGLLALLFLFTAGIKLLLPIEYVYRVFLHNHKL